jgi:hypothetical protein
MSTLPAACRAKLVKVLPLLGSDRPGEVVAAAPAAHRILTKAGISWGDILATAPALHREPLLGTWRTTCTELLKHQGSLRPWEHAQRVRLDNLGQLGELMTSVKSNQDLGLGRLRDNLPDCVLIMTKAAAAKLNGSVPPNTITRTAEAIDYTPGEAAVALIDFDQKGMPTDVRARVAAAGGCEGILTTIVPELATCGRVVRTSTSTGIYRTDTGATMRGPAACTSCPSSRTGGMSSDSFGRCTSDAGLLVADGTSSVQPASCSSVVSSIKWCMRRSASSSKVRRS